MKLTTLFENETPVKDLARVLYSSDNIREFVQDPHYNLAKKKCYIEMYQSGFLSGTDTFKLKNLSKPPIMTGLVYVPLVILADQANRFGVDNYRSHPLDILLKVHEPVEYYAPLSILSVHTTFEKLMKLLKQYYKEQHTLEDVKASEVVEYCVDDLKDEINEFANTLEELDIPYSTIWGGGGVTKLNLYINNVISFIYANESHMS